MAPKRRAATPTPNLRNMINIDQLSPSQMGRPLEKVVADAVRRYQGITDPLHPAYLGSAAHIVKCLAASVTVAHPDVVDGLSTVRGSSTRTSSARRMFATSYPRLRPVRKFGLVATRPACRALPVSATLTGLRTASRLEATTPIRRHGAELVQAPMDTMGQMLPTTTSTSTGA